MPSLILGRQVARALARSINRAAIGKGLLELGDAVECMDGARACGGRGRVGCAFPVNGERGIAEDGREVLDGVDVEGEDAIEAALADVGEGLERLPIQKRQFFLRGRGWRGFGLGIRRCGEGKGSA